MKNIQSIFICVSLILFISAAVEGNYIELCAPCLNGYAQDCGSNNGTIIKCVTIPLDVCYSINNGIVSGSIYSSMNNCYQQIGGISNTESCGTCSSGTTLTCHSGNTTGSTTGTFNSTTSGISTLNRTTTGPYLTTGSTTFNPSTTTGGGDSYIQLCGVCAQGSLQGCGISGSIICVSIPLGNYLLIFIYFTFSTFNDICRGTPIGSAYYINSINNGIVSGSVYRSMNDCNQQIGSIPITQSCGSCESGTTVTCHNGNTGPITTGSITATGNSIFNSTTSSGSSTSIGTEETNNSSSLKSNLFENGHWFSLYFHGDCNQRNRSMSINEECGECNYDSILTCDPDNSTGSITTTTTIGSVTNTVTTRVNSDSYVVINTTTVSSDSSTLTTTITSTITFGGDSNVVTTTTYSEGTKTTTDTFSLNIISLKIFKISIPHFGEI
ncbi:hypothetical protein PPL_10932 [Heterostelium album PN500]|uniref:Uncharacterized protein n=1 Tax=Heterostelium pallidum (strain ATCC 26659 / Pp 5 / PN500) TaxID=670386 RepID=D3BSG4_HETP5|nr:hypothetical protein PPL_10932 [Heterostelium album PN500]EFA75670.1 hypothetical protein PPL_10932 [Heterostelium album PN500]|eukprot:XP_020427804.1 hypothetical protein PPL_10932 [Heterostelium album PN500]